MPGQRTGHLLRIPRTDTDNPDDFILLRANPSSSSSAPLDAYLLATEGEAAYGLKLKNSTVHKFIHKTFTGTHEDFRTILSSLLLQAPVNSEDTALLEGIGITATIIGGAITLTARKSVGGIKQRIAAFDIPQTEDEIELYSWVGEVCTARDETEAKLRAREEKLNVLEKEVHRLLAQLKDLTTLKKEHEDAMLVKFQELLNSKKQHIRTLTQLVDASGRQENSPEPTASSKLATKAKNPRKRAAAPVEEEDESDGGFAVPVKPFDDEDDVDSDQKSDPRATEDEVEAGTSGDEASKQPASKVKSKSAALSKGKGKAATTTVTGGKKSAASAAQPKTLTRTGRGGSKNATATKSSTATRGRAATRGRGRGRKAPESSEPEESEEEKAIPPEVEKALPPAPLDDSDATDATDDDEL